MVIKYGAIFLLLCLLSFTSLYLGILYAPWFFGIGAIAYLLEVILRLNGYSLADFFRLPPTHCPMCHTKLSEKRSMYSLYIARFVAQPFEEPLKNCPKCGHSLYSRTSSRKKKSASKN